MEIVPQGIGICLNGTCYVIAWWIVSLFLLVFLGMAASIYVAVKGIKK